MMTGSRRDITALKDAARGKWRTILAALQIDVPATATQHGPCPTCGGKDRFRFDDKSGHGSWFCNQCTPHAGDGFALVRNVRGCGFPDALQLVAAVVDYHPGPGNTPRRIVATYDYPDATGTCLFQVVRYVPKGFRQRRPDGQGGWIWNLTGVEPVLYHLPAVHAASSVLIVEGEKDVETASRLGLPEGWAATCNPMGAGKWRAAYTAVLQGKHVVILPDGDAPGEQHAAQVAESLQGTAATVSRLTLPDGYKDLSEWADASGTTPALQALLQTAHPFVCVSLSPVPGKAPQITGEGGDFTLLPEMEKQDCVGIPESGPCPDAVPPTASHLIYRCMTDVLAKPICWLWPGRIAQGKVSILAGNPGLGKSQVTVYMAATVSTGGRWPVEAHHCEIGNVIILSAEDDPSDTIRPRLEAAGADLSKIYILDAVRDAPLAGKPETARAFNLQTDIAHLSAMLQKIGGAALVIIDPISAYLGTTDSHKNAEVRALLSRVADLAEQHEAAVVAVSHFNKNANAEAVMRVTGSLAFVAAARAAYVVTKDPEHEARRLLLPLKNNLGNDQSGLAFRVESVQVESPIGLIETSRVVWEPSVVTLTADDVMTSHTHTEEQSDLDDAQDFLRGLLAEGPVSSKQIKQDADGAGHAWRTIQRAQRALGIVAVKQGMKGGWVWQLPPEDCHERPKAAVSEAWQPSDGSSGRGGLRGGETVPVEGGGQGASPPLYAHELVEVINLDT